MPAASRQPSLVLRLVAVPAATSVFWVAFTVLVGSVAGDATAWVLSRLR